MISKRHWLTAGVIAICLHLAAFYAFFYKESEGSKASGHQGVEFNLGMIGDMGAAKKSSMAKEASKKKVEATHKKVVKVAPKKEVVEKPKPEPKPTLKPEVKPKPEPTPTKVVKEKAVIKPKPVVKEKQSSPIVIPKKEPKVEPKKEIVKKAPPKKEEPTSKKVEPPKETEQVANTPAGKEAEQNTKAEDAGVRSKAARKATTGVGKSATSGGKKGAKASYMTKLAAILAQNKRYPRIARRRNEEGVVRVTFTVHPNGQISNANIIKSSGYPRLDKAVLDMLKRSSPLPAFSSDMAQTPFGLNLPVNFKLSDYY